MTITSTTTANDQEKFLASKLIANTFLKLVAASVCDKLAQPQGTGTTAYFVRYQRMNVPLSPLSEGTDPSDNTFSLTQVIVTLDQWGDVLTITDIAQLTTKHPIIAQATELMADNAQRVIDREIQIVWLTGTNVQYGDASVTSRRTITSGMTVTDTIINKARVTLVDQGAPPRGGPSTAVGNYQLGNVASGGSINGGLAYVGICGPQVMADIMKAGTSLGTWASTAMYANQKQLYTSEVGTWLGIRWVETNFIPKFQILGNTTAAVASGAAFGTDTPVVTAVTSGGSLKSSTTFFYKVTRKDLLRGFEEYISIAHSTSSTSTGDNESFTFDFSGLTAGYVYNLYFDTTVAGGAGTDATMKLVSANIAVGTVVTVTANPSTGATPPDNVNTTGTPTVHPIYIHGNESCNWVGLQNLEVKLTDNDRPTTDNPLNLRRKLGYKFMAKCMIRDQLRMLRVEVPSSY